MTIIGWPVTGSSAPDGSGIGPGEFMQETTMLGETPDGNGGLMVKVEGVRKL